MSRRSRKAPASTPVEATKHHDTRTNIPTGELRDFVADDEAAPATVRYPRDPSLDPQLVWRGKDEQDAEDLSVRSAPIYIQEKISPRALIEDLRRTGGGHEPEPNLFEGFNGLEFDQLVDFYRHEQQWSNRVILGDSLLVMTSLAQKERLAGKVQMIYLDPPYGIKFGSNWQVSTRKRDVKDGKDTDLTRQPEMIKAFRDTWSSGSTPISATCATASSSPASCSPSPAASSSRSATRMSTWCGRSWTRSSAARTSSR